MQAHNKASAWFDELYKKHQNNHDNIPWARQDVNPLLQIYLDEKIKVAGLKELQAELISESSHISDIKFRVLYTK